MRGSFNKKINLQIVNFFKDFYKGILLGILLLLFVIFFSIFLNDFISSNSFNEIPIIIIQFSIWAFGITFLLYLIFIGEFYIQFHSEFAQYEFNDLRRVKNIVKTILIIYASIVLMCSLSIFSIINFSFEKIDLKTLYLLIFPIATLSIMTILYKIASKL